MLVINRMLYTSLCKQCIKEKSGEIKKQTEISTFGEIFEEHARWKTDNFVLYNAGVCCIGFQEGVLIF